MRKAQGGGEAFLGVARTPAAPDQQKTRTVIGPRFSYSEKTTLCLAGLGRHGEELDDVRDVGVAALFQHLLDGLHGGAQLRGRVGVDRGDLVGLLADDVVGVGSTEVDRVKRRAVVVERALHQPDLFERREAAVNSHEIAGTVFEVGVQVLDARGLAARDQGAKDGDARLRDTQTRGLKARAGEIER